MTENPEVFKKQLISFLGENLEIECNRDFDGYDSKGYTINLKLCGETISSAWFSV